eukprot:CAMPEP_0116876624 /NCGR_PEP_ID=MMETSP0463-20121206/8520_1 /TAXON_ID=181622 /ORGANISM="Strombidinopsis sp, Strain SopsisLIS2011" /LENGTH=31 /DNA_ID= /DNA_START= /DNA_END= /DNA_ORIENTATION=
MRSKKYGLDIPVFCPDGLTKDDLKKREDELV